MAYGQQGYGNNGGGRQGGFQKKDNAGTLFQEEKQSERHPDWKGYVLIGGVEHKISGWFKEAKTTGKMTIQLKVGDTRQEAPQQPQQPLHRSTQGTYSLQNPAAGQYGQSQAPRQASGYQRPAQATQQGGYPKQGQQFPGQQGGRPQGDYVPPGPTNNAPPHTEADEPLPF